MITGPVFFNKPMTKLEAIIWLAKSDLNNYNEWVEAGLWNVTQSIVLGKKDNYTVNELQELKRIAENN